MNGDLYLYSEHLRVEIGEEQIWEQHVFYVNKNYFAHEEIEAPSLRELPKVI